MTATPRTWTLSALELMVLWHAIGREILPYPLQYRATERTADDYTRAYQAAAARVQTLFDEDMYGPLRLLVDPEARVEVAGFAGTPQPVSPRTSADPTAQIRMHAAVAGSGTVLLTQYPTDDPHRGGDIRIALGNTRNLARHILTHLPDTARGSSPEIRINRRELDEPDDTPFTGFTDDTPQPARREVHRFFERPRTTVAHIAIYPGGAYDHRPVPTRDFHIIDYPDGRYRVRATATVHAIPTDNTELATHLHNLLDRTTKEYREDHTR